MPRTITQEIIMKKTLLIFCMLLINNPLNAGNTKVTRSDTIHVVGLCAFLLGPIVRNYIRREEPRANLSAVGPFGCAYINNLCTAVTPELTHFISEFCPNATIDIQVKPRSRVGETCVIPSLNVMERIESTCKPTESKAKSLFSTTCPAESKEKNNARIKLRQKIRDLETKRQSKK